MSLLKQNSSKVIILIIFSGLFLVGINTYQDYGISVDEKFQRSNGFFWLDYLLSYTNLNDLKNLVSQKLIDIEDFTLADVSKFKIYGILFDLPAALLEVLLKLEDTKDIYNLRHLLNFLYFFVGSIFFYKILINRFNSFISLIGTLFFLSSPRIYGESFYNSKDIIFLSFLCIAIFYCFQFLKKKGVYNLILFSFFTAACIQTRVIGIFLPFSFLIFYIFAIISDKKEITFISKYLFYFGMTFLFLEPLAFISWIGIEFVSSAAAWDRIKELVDKILHLESGKTVSAIKNVTINEPFFLGHFPDKPVMPGVLLLESMAQAGGFLVLHSIDNPKEKLIY